MNLVKRTLVLALAAVAITAFAADLVVTEANAPTFYRDFTRLTQQPHFVTPLIAMLCTTAPPSAELIEQEKQMTGPHHHARVHLYANPAAMPTFKEPGTPFAVGSVIVKEKLSFDGKITGVGGMIKRASGYDADNGDWEFFYYGKPGEFASGRIDNCVACHRGAKATDHVFSFSFLEH